MFLNIRDRFELIGQYVFTDYLIIKNFSISFERKKRGAIVEKRLTNGTVLGSHINRFMHRYL